MKNTTSPSIFFPLSRDRHFLKLLSSLNRQTWMILFFLPLAFSCTDPKKEETPKQPKNEMTAKDILGNSNYQAISYGGYRENTRDIQPTIPQLKEDMKILHAMGIRILRTYNVQLQQVPNLMKAIRELKEENPDFEMYVMMGAWIDCKNAWTELEPDHHVESEQNAGEIDRAVALANQYPDIIKILAVGNEAMIRWATSYYVQPNVILKWVNHVQDLKKNGKLPKDLWITCSDDFASWGGGEEDYKTEDLASLIKAVDYVSMHTYPYHNSYYNPEFWHVPKAEQDLPELEAIDLAMQRTLEFSKKQFEAVKAHVHSIAPGKALHIGETGWATISNGHYGPNQSKATDQYKQAMFHRLMRDWTEEEGISCFYFEAFDEPWKDAKNTKGSENHFGLFTKEGQAKYALWDQVDQGTFEGLSRDGNPIVKTFNGKKEQVMSEALVPPFA